MEIENNIRSKFKKPKFLKKEIFCEKIDGGMDGIKCKYASIYRYMFFISLISILIIITIYFLIFLGGGFSYESSFTNLFGFGLFIIITCFILMIISAFFLLSNTYGKISFIVSMIVFGGLLIYIIVIHV